MTEIEELEHEHRLLRARIDRLEREAAELRQRLGMVKRRGMVEGFVMVRLADVMGAVDGEEAVRAQSL